MPPRLALRGRGRSWAISAWRANRRTWPWCWEHPVAEGACEFEHGSAATVKSASGNMHGVVAQHHRRGVVGEFNREVAVYYGSVVRRSSINRKIARLNSGRVNRFTKVDIEDSRLVEYHTGTGAGHRTRLCQRERDRADCQKHVNRAPKKVCLKRGVILYFHKSAFDDILAGSFVIRQQRDSSAKRVGIR